MEVNDAARTIVPFGDGRRYRGGDHSSASQSGNGRNGLASAPAIVLSFADGKRKREEAMQGITFNKVLVVAVGVIVGMTLARMLGASRFLAAAA